MPWFENTAEQVDVQKVKWFVGGVLLFVVLPGALGAGGALALGYPPEYAVMAAFVGATCAVPLIVAAAIAASYVGWISPDSAWYPARFAFWVPFIAFLAAKRPSGI